MHGFARMSATEMFASLRFRFVFLALPSTMLLVKPKPQTLDDLLASAECYAKNAFRKTGAMPPTLFLIGADGPQMMIPESLEDDAAKNDFATNARLMCIAHGATACVMALEAWAKFAKVDEIFDVNEPPSEAFDRREVVLLMGEDRTGQKQKFLPIVRSGNGKFFGFGEQSSLSPDETQGRFAQILPPRVPAESERLLAEAMLKVKGGTATNPSTARTRRIFQG